MVGSANGRSMTASTTPFPTNRSRTSIQAIAVPARALTSAQIAATPSVSFSAAIASGRVAWCQNASSASARELQMSAARGRSTTMLR